VPDRNPSGSVSIGDFGITSSQGPFGEQPQQLIFSFQELDTFGSSNNHDFKAPKLSAGTSETSSYLSWANNYEVNYAII